MADNRQINEKYAKIGQKLIDTEDVLYDVRNSHASIIYLSSDLAKTDKDRFVLGQCERVADKYKWSIPADFTITLFEPNIEGKSDEAIRRIIFHELLHVRSSTSKDIDEIYYIRGHDFEDFKVLIYMWDTDYASVGEKAEFEPILDEWKVVNEDGE